MATVSHTDSILNSTKLALGIVESYPYFDPQITMCINSVFSTLYQLGIGPENGFSIEDETTTWNEYLEGNKLLNFVISFMHLSVKLMFDPPTSSFALQAMKDQIEEMKWRINVMVDPEKRGA